MSQSICPICKSNNNCMIASNKTCWCNDIKVDKGLIDLVAEKDQAKSCICRSCIKKFNINKAAS
ncbi:MAG: cysteine-rich CWC family protein [Pseudomonadota bacterium]